MLCAAHPLCLSPDPLDSSKSPHRCIGCGLHIHCELWCGKFWNILDVHPSQLPEYGCGRITSGDFVPSDSSVLCYRCIGYAEQQQKLPANDNAQVLPSSSLSNLLNRLWTRFLKKASLLMIISGLTCCKMRDLLKRRSSRTREKR